MSAPPPAANLTGLWLGQDDLVTGEAVALDVPAASFGLRMLSGAIDVIVQIVLLIGLALLGIAAAETTAQKSIAITVASVLALVGWPVVWETFTHGRTPGKFALRMRTVRDDGGPISFRHALTRALLGTVEIFAFTGMPAMFSALVSRKSKRIGDLLAGTYVIRSRQALLLPPPPPMPEYLQAWAEQADISVIPDRLAVGIRQVLASPTMTPDVRGYLVGDLAARTASLVRPLPPAGTPPTDFLAAVLAERRRRDLNRMQREAQQRARLTAKLPR